MKKKAPRNKTLYFEPGDEIQYGKNLLNLRDKVQCDVLTDKIIDQNLLEVLPFLPDSFVDLLFVDPPYNLTKEFGIEKFKKMSLDSYERYLIPWLEPLRRILKPNASVYVCGDWQSSAAIHRVLDNYFYVQNRIVWEREKGRGALRNWKNNTEDIWFATNSKEYYFDPQAVKLRRKVIAPYRDASGRAKDWQEEGKDKFRDTFPSNIWTDISIPFWSMSENTEHPTQKPEKLLAKIILASSKPCDVVFDPFFGSGTTAVAAKKLGRHYVGIEIDRKYALLAEKRLARVEYHSVIQGYEDGVFWERNTLVNKRNNSAINIETSKKENE